MYAHQLHVASVNNIHTPQDCVAHFLFIPYNLVLTTVNREIVDVKIFSQAQQGYENYTHKRFSTAIITTTKYYVLKKQPRTHVLACQPNAGVNCIAGVGNQMSDVDSKVFKAEKRFTTP